MEKSFLSLKPYISYIKQCLVVYIYIFVGKPPSKDELHKWFFEVYGHKANPVQASLLGEVFLLGNGRVKFSEGVHFGRNGLHVVYALP